MNLARIGQISVLAAAGAVLLYTLRPEHVNDARSLIGAAHRQAMPDITLSDLDGRTWRLEDHAGQVVLVNFWATWCPPCREETPGLVHLAKSYRDRGVAVVGISMDEGGGEAARKFARDYRVGYPILLPDQRFPFANRVEDLPTSLLIDQHGKVAKTYIGAVSEATFHHDIDKLLDTAGKGV
jgi:thiol-disulfide isomerase/thioredoxin